LPVGPSLFSDNSPIARGYGAAGGLGLNRKANGRHPHQNARAVALVRWVGRSKYFVAK
jgi:hypothetical protein